MSRKGAAKRINKTNERRSKEFEIPAWQLVDLDNKVLHYYYGDADYEFYMKKYLKDKQFRKEFDANVELFYAEYPQMKDNPKSNVRLAYSQTNDTENER